MAQAGVPLWKIAGFLGHKTPLMVMEMETYAHHHPDHLKDAARALG